MEGTVLIHHGIKGQKWGERNGPPYPLDKETNVRVRMSRYNGDHYDVHYKKIDINDKKETLDSLKKKTNYETFDKDCEYVNSEYEPGRSYNCQNCAVALEMRRRGFDVIAKQRPDGSNVGGIESVFKNGKIETISFDYKNDPEFKKGLEINDELNKIIKKNGGPMGLYMRDDKYTKLRNECDDIAWNLAQSSKSNFIKQLSNQGSGARGIVILSHGSYDDIYDKTRFSSLYHAFNYEVTNDGVNFYDSQPRRYPGQRNIDLENTNPFEYHYMRTDNVELNNNATDYVKSRG